MQTAFYLVRIGLGHVFMGKAFYRSAWPVRVYKNSNKKLGGIIILYILIFLASLKP